MATYTNPFVIGNTGQPPDRLGHNACWPEGLARDNSNRIYEVRGWDEAHDDIVRRDPANGNIVWNSLQINPGHNLESICVEPDGSWAYGGGSSENGGQYRASVFRFNLADGIPPEQRRVAFTTAGERIEVYAYGQIPAGVDQTPLNSIAVYGGSIYVTDSYGGRVLKYDKVTGVLQSQITGLPGACGLTISPSGVIWVGHDGDKVSAYEGTTLRGTTDLNGDQVYSLSLLNDVMAVAFPTAGIHTRRIAGFALTDSLSTYGLPWRAGDGAPDRVREIHGMVMLGNGEIVFSDRAGFNGRIQKIGTDNNSKWQHLALEFTSNISFAPQQPNVWVSSGRQIYNVLLDGSWTYIGNGQTESFTDKDYFGHFVSTDTGPPRLLKLGGSYFFYYPVGTGIGIYRLVNQADRGPKLQIASAVSGAQPSPYGDKLEPTWQPQNLYLWQWQDKVGDGVIRSEDTEILFQPGSPGSHWAIDAVTVDDVGTLWVRDGNNKVTKIALDSLNPLGNPIYKAENRQVIFTEQNAKDALGVSDGIAFQMCVRADGDVYLLCSVNNPAYPPQDEEWMAGNAIIAFAPNGTARWGKILPFSSVGIAAVSLGGGLCIGSNKSPAPGTIYHYDKDGNQLKQLRPDIRFGENDPRIPSGGLDSRMSLACQRDPRDGQVKVFATDNLNQRIIVYSINDSLLIVFPDKIRFYPRPTWESRMANGIFEGSNVSQAGPYTLIHQIPSQQPPAGWNEIVNVDLSPYRYLRFRSPANGYGNVTEIEFYRNGIKATGEGFGSPGSYENSGLTFHKALDGDLGTYFDGPAANGQFVGIDAPIPDIPPVSCCCCMPGQGSYNLLYQIAQNTAGTQPVAGDGIYALACKVLRNMGGTPAVSDSLYSLFYKIAEVTAGVRPKPGDGMYNLLSKIADNTNKQDVIAGDPSVGDGLQNLLSKISKNTGK